MGVQRIPSCTYSSCNVEKREACLHCCMEGLGREAYRQNGRQKGRIIKILFSFPFQKRKAVRKWRKHKFFHWNSRANTNITGCGVLFLTGESASMGGKGREREKRKSHDGLIITPMHELLLGHCILEEERACSPALCLHPPFGLANHNSCLEILLCKATFF